MSRYFSLATFCLLAIFAHAQAKETVKQSDKGKTSSIQLQTPEEMLEVLQEEKDDLTLIDRMIKASQDNVQKLTALKQMMESYKKAQKNCMEDPNNPQKLLKMAQSGKEVFDKIQDLHLSQYFSSELISELSMLAKMADKKQIPPVRAKS